jgi:hypothetical protein
VILQHRFRRVDSLQAHALMTVAQQQRIAIDDALHLVNSARRAA